MPNFSLWRTGYALNATPSAAVQALPANPTGAGVLMVYNPGPELVRLVVGKADMSPATHLGSARAMPIEAGEKGAWHIGDATHASVWIAGGTQEVECFYGWGE